MKFGVPLVAVRPDAWGDVAAVADEVGFESIWIADHLVFPVRMEGELSPGEEHPPVPPTVPVYDPTAYLCYLAARTTRVRLGVYVYLAALRHPFTFARAFTTLDAVSGGRAEVGVGAGWLRNEWTAAGFDPATRGRRLDEALEVSIRLWTEDTVEHHGEFYDFEEVAFEPKPVQRPHPPVLVGGESPAAIRRAARYQGWMGMVHTPESAAPLAAQLPDHIEVTVSGECSSADDLRRWEDAGVDRLVVRPWRRTADAVAGIQRFAERFVHP